MANNLFARRTTATKRRSTRATAAQAAYAAAVLSHLLNGTRRTTATKRRAPVRRNNKRKTVARPRTRWY